MRTSETKSETHPRRGFLQRFRLHGGHHRKLFKKREMRDDPDITSSSGSSQELTRCPQTTLAARSQVVSQAGQSLSSNELLELARSTHKESIAQGLALLQGMEDNAKRSLRRNQEANWEDSFSVGLPDQSFRSIDTPPTPNRFDPTTSPFDARSSSSKWAAIKPSSAPSSLADGGRGGSASATSNPHLHTGTPSTEVPVSLVVPRLLNTSSAKPAW